MEQISISEATDLERDWCAELMAHSDPWITLGRGLESCRASCHHPEYKLFVAHSHEQPCGFVLTHPRGVASSPYIASIATAKEFRGRGVGAQLLQFVEDYFREKSRHIFLCVSSFNHLARKLYERSGYTIVGEFEDYVIDGASEFLMHKWLRRS